MRLGRVLAHAVLAGALVGAGVAVAQEFPAFAHAPLTPSALRAHIAALSSDAFEGRAPATRGEALTTEYIIRSFTAAGLAPGGDLRADGARDWRQRVALVTAQVSNNPLLVISGADGAAALRHGEDVVLWSKRRAQRVALERAPIVFVGYGVVSPELGWNDYAGVDVAGKIALMLDGDPDDETGDDRGFHGAAASLHGRWITKIEEAGRRGAAGALIIYDNETPGSDWATLAAARGGVQIDLLRTDDGVSRPSVEGWLRREAGAGLFARAGLSYAVEKARAQRPDFTARELGLTGSAVLDIALGTLASHNVVGVLGGRTRHQEAVLYAAHWDHLGRCAPEGGDNICNGALDNASGVAGLIELARRFSSSGRTERSVVFLATTAEEAGMLGAAHYVRHGAMRPETIAGMINLDLINIAGPARDIAVIGDGQNELETLLTQAARRHGRRVSPDPAPRLGLLYRSDQFPFASAGVPVLFTRAGFDLHDGGAARGRLAAESYLALRYHRPSDEMTDDWDLTGAFQDLLLLYEVGDRLANSTAWPDWNSGSEFKPIRDASRRRRR